MAGGKCVFPGGYRQRRRSLVKAPVDDDRMRIEDVRVVDRAVKYGATILFDWRCYGHNWRGTEVLKEYVFARGAIFARHADAVIARDRRLKLNELIPIIE